MGAARLIKVDIKTGLLRRYFGRAISYKRYAYKVNVSTTCWHYDSNWLAWSTLQFCYVLNWNVYKIFLTTFSRISIVKEFTDKQVFIARYYTRETSVRLRVTQYDIYYFCCKKVIKLIWILNSTLAPLALFLSLNFRFRIVEKFLTQTQHHNAWSDKKSNSEL